MTAVAATVSVNQALRAACGAAKMLARSELVECPYEIDTTKIGGQCPEPFDPTLPQTNQYDELHRIYVFLRSVQQGIQPPIHIARLPIEEEKEFVNEIFNAAKEFKALPNNKPDDFDKYFFANVLRVTPTDKNIDYIKTKYIQFQGTQGNPLVAFNCKKLYFPFETQLWRLMSFFLKGPIFLQQQLENYSAADDFERIHGFKPASPVTISATNDINKIIIKIIRENDSVEKEIPVIKNIKDVTLDTGLIKDLYYIRIKNDTNGVELSYPDAFGIVNFRVQSVIKYIFDNNLVLDVQPYLMYLLQTDISASDTFMARSFDGKMIPSVQYPLAYYIIAHYVANRPPYKNPADFYNLPIKPNNEKLPIMLAALKANSSELKPLITEGYAWLKKDKAPTITDLIRWLGGGVGSIFEYKARKAASKFASMFRSGTRKQGQGGGKRVTRKVRILPVNG